MASALTVSARDGGETKPALRKATTAGGSVIAFLLRARDRGEDVGTGGAAGGPQGGQDADDDHAAEGTRDDHGGNGEIEDGGADDDVLHDTAQQEANAYAEEASVGRDDHALAPDRTPYQGTGCADGAEDADLPRAFQDRQ